MKSESLLRDYQVEAVNACLNAINKGQKRVFVEMPVGSGISIVLINVAKNLLSSNKVKNILWLTDTVQMQEQQLNLSRDLIGTITLAKQSNFIEAGINFATVQSILKVDSKINISLYDIIILGSVSRFYQKLNILLADKITIGNLGKNGSLCSNEEVVYVYTPKDHMRAYSYEVELFCAKVLEQYGAVNQEVHLDHYDADIILETNDKQFLIEIKAYRDKNIGKEMLERAAAQIFKSHFNKEKYTPCIMCFAKVEESIKEYFSNNGVEIWDISTIIYLCGNSSYLLSELSRLSFHDISEITPTSISLLVKKDDLNELIDEIECSDEDIVKHLKKELQECPYGKKNKADQKFEQICKQILYYLFETEFSQLSSQHKTKDKLFRMDFLCAFKGLSDFWKLLMVHYNTRFVVFECKNYKEKISQNLIYITEKYLFDSALRNVAFIISRKGFDAHANDASLGCLKENGKLIIDLTDDDLINMINKKGEGGEPSEYLLFKLEQTLMSIGK